MIHIFLLRNFALPDKYEDGWGKTQNGKWLAQNGAGNSIGRVLEIAKL